MSRNICLDASGARNELMEIGPGPRSRGVREEEEQKELVVARGICCGAISGSCGCVGDMMGRF